MASLARAAWRAWHELATAGSVAELIDNAGDRCGELAAAVELLRADAAKVLQRRSEAWQPMAAALAGWTELARSSQRAEAVLSNVTKAIGWLRTVESDIQDVRMGPFAEKSAVVWELLKRESNVELRPIRLEGVATQRRVALDVTVDGIGGAALSVMSQDDLHALGLAWFLPRGHCGGAPLQFRRA